MDKPTFKKAFEELKKNEAPIVKEILTKKCKWGTHNFFYAKKRGTRPISEMSEKGVNEIQIIESTFKAFGIDAWTGEKI